ncbi:hypothetical protein OROMI_003655 [Orobanche minor]
MYIYMEGEPMKEKKTRSILKKLERYLLSKRKVAPPAGCFSVYVGPEKKRFVIKTEFANHQLFRILLEDAELEYGFTNKGPLLLPCEVDFFVKVLAEMDCDGTNGEDSDDQYDQPCGFSYGSCSPFNSTRHLGKSGLAQGCGSYHLRTPPPRFVKINHF